MRHKHKSYPAITYDLSRPAFDLFDIPMLEFNDFVE